MDFFGWIHDFVSWFRSFVGVHERPAPFLEEHSAQNGDCILRLLYNEDSNFPGCVAVWQVSHISAQSDLLLICINVAQAREEMGKTEGDRQSVNWRRDFEIKARVAIKVQAAIAGTHLFMSGWLSKAAIERTGSTEHYRPLELGACYLVDLQGGMAAYMGLNFYAERILRAIAFRCADITPSALNTWEEIIRSLDRKTSETTWLTWLEHYACRHPKTRLPDNNHILQPPQSRKASKRRSGMNPTR